MEFEAFIKKMKAINSALIDFIEATDDHNAELETLIEVLEKQKILENKKEIQLLFQLISKITDNHHRTSDFFDKLEKIFQYLIKDIPTTISYFIPDYTKYNKRILYLLLEKGFVKSDEIFLKQYLKSNPIVNRLEWKFFHNKKEPDMSQTFYYLYPKMKEFLDEKLQKQIEEEITEKYSETISTFEEKCQIGENDSYICSLIRKDSVEEFIIYVNRTNLSLLTKIKPSIYETNSFLIDKEPTLIEYAAFYGSIQIIQYLKYNKVPLTSSLWVYAIHSNNAELIHFLEENKVKPERNKIRSASRYYNFINKEKLFDDVLKESIKCHHNAITNYIKDNFYEQIQSNDENCFYDNFSSTVVDSLNYCFFPNKIDSIICKQKNNDGFKLSQLCSSLAQITIPSSITSIGNYAFDGCSSLMQLTIPSSVTSIGDHAFNGCSSLTQIAIPSSVTSFGKNIFNSIKILEIAGDIQYIPKYLFSGCSSLTQITIPSSVTSIGDYAFIRCSSLTKITIPSSVTSFGKSIFDSIKILEITGDIQYIPTELFSGCLSLTQITIPSSVTSIGDSTFFYCKSLTKITIPSSVTTFGKNIFNGIKSLEINGDIQYIPKDLFSGCTSLTQITIPSSVTSIGDYAFNECSSLTQITIPSSVTSIGNYAFNGCSSLTQIAIPSSVISIGNNVFSRCSSLTQITIPSSVTSIGNYAFNGCLSLTQITIPSSVTSIGNYAFNGCSSLTQITIPSSVTSIGDSAFNGCSSLTQIAIPSSVISIGNNVFSRCLSLTQITIPSSVTSIGNFAFSGCSRLTQITIPSSVTSIGNYAFDGCSKLTQITIPSSVTSIGNNIFCRCSSLTQIAIPSSVTSIGNYAFCYCSSLTQITIPSSVTSIGDYAFSYCKSLTQITIPSSVTSIGENAFRECSLLPTETIESINRIKSSIANCNNEIKHIKINKPTWKPNSNTSNNNASSLAAKNNNFSWMHNNKSQKNSWSNLGQNSNNQKYAWNQNSKIKNKNAIPWGTNNDQKFSCRDIINEHTIEDKSDKKLMNEFEIMKKLDHPNVLKAVDLIYNDKKAPSILYEKCSTNLNDAIQNKMFSKVQLVYSIYQIAEGMKYIHSNKIIHLNLKPANILISEDGTIKIGDFKNAEKVTSENENKKNDDIYSFGEIVYFILSGREINESEKESVIESFSLLARQLIEACFYDDSERRPTFEMICDILLQNNFNLISLSQQEIEDVSKLTSQYQKKKIA